MIGRRREYQLRVVESTLTRLKAIAAWFERQKRFHFYASSLLIVYEGDEIVGSSPNSPLCDVRMIDFSHVFNAKTTDSNYIFGLGNLVKHFEALGTKLKQQ